MGLLRQLKTNFPALVFLFGPEDVLIEEVIKRYKEEFKADDFNYMRLSIEDLEIDSLEQLIYSPPMFANARVVVLDSFELVFKKKDLQEEIVTNLEGISKSMTKLVFIATDSPDRRTKLYKKINEVGVVAESKFLNPHEKQQWLSRELGRKNLKMNRDVMQEFLLVAGDSLRELDNELSKLAAYKADTNGEVSIEEVRSIVSPSLESSIFRCVDALGNLNKEEAYDELQKLFTGNEPPLRILAMIIRQIRLIYQTKLLVEERASLERLRRELKVPNFVAKKLQEQAYNFDVATIESDLKSLRELELQIKTGKINDHYALELWILGHK